MLRDRDGEVGGLVRLNVDGVDFNNIEDMATHVDMQHCGHSKTDLD